MGRILGLLFGFLLLLARANGQNLIPNGGFEQYQRCPDLDNLLEEAAPWYNPNKATPDFYNRCFPTNQMELSPRTGQGLGRLFMDFAWAEYMATPLKQPLDAGEAYQFELYIASPSPTRYPSGSFGAYFSAKPLSSTEKALFAVKPQIIDASIQRMPTRLKWEKLDGCFVAKGGESHVTIGNFVQLPASLGLQLYYLFIDDVSLVPIKLNLGRDTTLCGRQSTLKLDAKTPGASEYKWSTGSTSSTLVVGKPGTYWVTVTTPCKVLRDTIKVDYVLPINLGPDTTLCNGESLTLRVVEPGTYQWQDGSSQATYVAKQAGRYMVEVSNATCVARDTIDVRYVPRPQLDLGADQRLCGTEVYTLTPVFTNGTFRWLDTFSETNRVVEMSGVFRAAVTNDCATVRDSVTVDYSGCECTVYAPNAFSPNDDGENDLFKPLACNDIRFSALSIFNRWGELIFRTTKPPFAWDGTYKGHPCPAAVYIWQADYTLKPLDKPMQPQTVQNRLVLLR